jgi:hypothetical protein
VTHDGLRPSQERPGDIDPRGIPGERSGREGFILAAALLVAVLGLIFTLGWVIFHQIVPNTPAPTDDQIPTQGPLPGEGEGGSTDS